MKSLINKTTTYLIFAYDSILMDVFDLTEMKTLQQLYFCHLGRYMNYSLTVFVNSNFVKLTRNLKIFLIKVH